MSYEDLAPANGFFMTDEEAFVQQQQQQQDGEVLGGEQQDVGQSSFAELGTGQETGQQSKRRFGP